MIVQRPIYHYARVVLEAITPHGVHSGRGDATHDVLLVRDANGLPFIPGTSLAGVLRHLYAEVHGESEAKRVFGHAEGSEGQPSWLNITAGLIHDSRNCAEEGLRDPLHEDPLLAFLREDKPLVRQRVRLGTRGTAEDTGKFDVTLVPAGARYTAFMGFWATDTEDDRAVFERLLTLLRSSAFRLGHGTRSGSGAFMVQALHTACWDLRTTQGQQGYCERARKRSSHQGLTPYQPGDQVMPDSVTTVTAILPLQAEGGLRVGGGEVSLTGSDDDERQPDLLPQSEPRIVWQQQRHNSGKTKGRRGQKAQERNTVTGRLSAPVPVLPGSAVKGAIAHRLAFHCRRLNGELLDPAGMAPPDDQTHPLVTDLLGWAGEGEANPGQAGCLLIDDIYLEQPTLCRQMHNRIDRYTGGVMQGALFEQELLWRPAWTLSLTLLRTDTLRNPVLRAALQATLQDLAEGMLPLGADGSRGQGCLLGTGTLAWSDEGAWIEQGVPEESGA